ncbi:MAG: hypothetical protein J3Q66DRAFT_341761 [Benniella sp.]|nr:MAG: hypothetical protein J3Q66DRAFT_341761 [Benniella sp.]
MSDVVATYGLLSVAMRSVPCFGALSSLIVQTCWVAVAGQDIFPPVTSPSSSSVHGRMSWSKSLLPFPRCRDIHTYPSGRCLVERHRA